MNTPVPEHGTYAPASAGAQLRAYRESAQLTIDDVAHHLKLARRQVLAIENDELDALPGPTFVRGFIRNYARLLRVDPAPLLEASGLTTAAAPGTSMEHIAPTMGELPADNAPATSWTRWIIPAGLVLLLAGGIAYYEFGNVAPGILHKAKKEAPAEVAAPSAAPTPAEPAAIQPPESAGQSAASPPVTQQAAEPIATQTPPAVPPPAAPASPATRGAANPPGSLAQSAPAAALPAVSAPATAAASSPLPEGTGRVDLAFTGTSWVEVRDAHGNLLISRTLDASRPQSLTGTLPLSVTIGNARTARLQFNGAPVDLAPYTQREVARLTLPPRR